MNNLSNEQVANYLDGQGNEVVINSSYKYVFAMPGPDTTILIVKSLNPDGTVNCFDVQFKFNVGDIKPKALFRPIHFPWKPYEEKMIKEFGGDL